MPPRRRRAAGYKPGTAPGVTKREHDLAWRATQRLAQRLPQLEHMARMITGDQRVKVKITADAPHTKNNVIFIRPPLGLGKDVPHKRSLCGERGSDGKQQCESCRHNEVVDFYLNHEIGHVAGKSHEPLTLEAMDEFWKLVDEWHPVEACTHGAYLRETVFGNPSRSTNAFAISSLFGEFLPTIVNCLEDTRVNNCIYEMRQGMRRVFEVNIQAIMDEGDERADGEVWTWKSEPLNAQFMIGLFLLSAGQYIDGRLHSFVVESLNDEAIRNICVRTVSATSISEIFVLGIEALRRAQELGFCEIPKCLPPEAEPTPPMPEDSEESNNEERGDSGDESGSESGSDPEQSDELLKPEDNSVSAGDGADVQEDEDEGDSDPGDDDDSESDPADEQSDGGEFGRNDSGTATPPEDPGGPGGVPEDSAPQDDDGLSDGPSDEADSVGSGGQGKEEEDGSTPPSVPGGDPGDRDSDDSDRVDGGSESDERSSEDPEESRDDDKDSDSERGNPRDDRLGDEQSDDESLDSDFEVDHAADDAKPEAESPKKESEGRDADFDADLPEDADEDFGDEEEVDHEGDDEEPYDPWATDGSEGAAPEEAPFDAPRSPVDGPPVEELGTGTPEDVRRAIAPFLMHGTGDGDSFLDHLADGEIEAVVMDPGEDVELPQPLKDLIMTVLDQLLFFDTSSLNVLGVDEVVFPNKKVEWFRDREIDYMDFMCSESVLGGAVLRARRVFEDNKRSKYVTGLKKGKINVKSLGYRAPAGDPHIFRKKFTPAKRDYELVMLLDKSGSNASNGRNEKVNRAAMASGELFSRLGVKFSIYGHTAAPHRSARYNPSLFYASSDYYLYILPVKKLEDPWNEESKTKLANLNPICDNLDGHALEYGRKLLQQSTATDKILIYYSDGVMPAANYEEEKEILKREIEICKKLGITLLGVGIHTDSPKQWGMDTVRIDNDEDIMKVLDQLEQRLER